MAQAAMRRRRLLLYRRRGRFLTVLAPVGSGYGLTLWRRGAISVLGPRTMVQVVLGNWWTPVPEVRRDGDWARQRGPLTLIRGDWWKAPA
jgi:hypothetical protein